MLARIGVKFFQIVGVPSESEWSQLQVVNSSSYEEMEKGGGLSVLMNVEGEKASERGNEWLQAVVEGFLKNIDQDRVEWMKETVRWFEGVSGPSDGLLLLIVLPHEGSVKRALYLAGKGGIKVYVSRGGAQKNIWNGDKGVVSGWLNDEDVVVAGTDSFIDDVWANLEGDVVDMVDEARGSIGAHEKRGQMAGIVLVMGKGEEELSSTVIPAADLTAEKNENFEEDKTEEKEETVDAQEEQQNNGEEKEAEDVKRELTVEDEAPEVKKEEIEEEEVRGSDDAVVSEIKDSDIDENFKMVEQVVDELPAADGVVDEKKVETPEEDVDLGAQVEEAKDSVFEERVLGGASVGQLLPDSEKREKTRKLAALMGLVFLLIFGVALSVGVIKTKRDGEKKKFAEFVEPIDYNLSEALKLKTVNQVRSRALVEEARTKYAGGSSYEKGRFETDYRDLMTKIENTWKEISGERGADGKLFADLNVIRDGFLITRVVYDDNWGFVAVDRDKGSVALIDKDGTMKIVAGGDKYKTLRSMTLGKKGGYFLTDDGVYLVDFKTQAEKKLVEKDDEIWSGVKEVGLFGSSVYLLDNVDIWKYPGLDDGVGKRQRWFKPGVEPDLKDAVDMKIATDIYVLLKSEEVVKFASGTKDAFDLREVSDKGEAARMAISEKNKELYVLEKDKKRIVVYDMGNGEYKKQLIWESLSGASDLVSSDLIDKLFVAIDGKMFEVVFQ